MAFHWHEDTFDIPRGAVRLAESEGCRNQLFSFGEKILGMQFHFEVTRTYIEKWIMGLSDRTNEKYVQTRKEIMLGSKNIAEANKNMVKILNMLSGALAV